MNAFVRIAAAAFALLALIPLVGCGRHAEEPHLMDRIRAADTPPDSAAAHPGPDVQSFYDRLETVAFREPRDGSASPGPGDSFRVVDRRPSIRRFPCSECHALQGPPTGDRRAHFGIVLDHAPTAAMNCATCHGSAMAQDSLASLAGGKFAFELPHRLCAQCHFEQARDFLGGAHGKRVHGWQGTRVLQSCTACHDPHAPALPKRWPSTQQTPDQERG